MDPPKRRLPVLKEPPAEPEEARPPWQWAGFGAVALFGVWLPLATAAEALKDRVVRGGVGDARTLEDARASVLALAPGARARLWAALVVPHVLALALAAWAAGYLVGRFGGVAGPREAAVAGVGSVLVATVLAVASGAPASTLLAALVAGALAGTVAALGARAGRRAPRA